MSNLLISRKPRSTSQTRAENSVNGGDAETFAMAKVVLACRGEGQWGSREDDNSKIDLIFSSRHPWHAGERMLVLCQVKSGAAYGATLPARTGFKLMGAAKTAAKRSSHDICVVWVDRDADRAFWAYIHPDTRSDVQLYAGHHEISPAMIFDLARCMASRRRGGSEGGNGVMLPPEAHDFRAQRKAALVSYRQTKTVRSPILGDIEFTKVGWRHMFRKSRSARNKSASANIIPRLRPLLQSHPSSNVITSMYIQEIDGMTYRKCEHLLKFAKVNIRDNSRGFRNIVAHVRIMEEIRYPTDWDQKSMLSQIVERRLALKSAYYKES